MKPMSKILSLARLSARTKDKNRMANKAEKNRVEALKKMLDPATWPVRPDNMLLIHGEVWSFETDDPLEEIVYRPLFRWSDKLIICR
jgi:hypothetical protein